jgi:lipopolysaccharide export system protein LptA
VTIITANEKIFAESLYYDGKHDSVEMYGNVLIEDKKNDMSVAGDRGWYNLSRDEGSLSGSPKLEIARQGKVPITVYAEAFTLYTSEDLFYGFDSVQALIDSIVVHCDTFSYDLKAESGIMVRPTINEKNNELKGARGRFLLKNKEIELMSVEHGESTYYTKEGSRNIVEGDRINIKFQEGRATMIDVQGDPKGTLSIKKSADNAGD